jgi:hypothetical protein
MADRFVDHHHHRDCDSDKCFKLDGPPQHRVTRTFGWKVCPGGL